MKKMQKSTIGTGFRMNPFTLIELLLVIAIIAILTGMLLPALNRVKETAKGMTCLNNMRQISLGSHQYIDDFRNYFPSYYHITVTQWYRIRGMSGLGRPSEEFNKPGGYIPGLPRMAKVDGAARDGLPTGSWRCPAMETVAKVHYGLNFYTFGLYATSSAHMIALHIKTVTNPASRLFLADFTGENQTYPAVAAVDNTNTHLFGLNTVALRHAKKANVLFFDGHVVSTAGVKPFTRRINGQISELWGKDAY